MSLIEKKFEKGLDHSKVVEMTRDTFQKISNSAFKALDADEKIKLLGGAHVQAVNHPDLAKALLECRMLGFAKAREDGRPISDIVCILAHDANYETFFKDHPKLTPPQRERMIEAFSLEETVAYEALEGVEKLVYERDWATERWHWKRYAGNFTGGEKLPERWATWFMYRSDIDLDPICQDPGHPWSGIWKDMTELSPDGIKYLVIAGNCASVLVGVPRELSEEEEEAEEAAVSP